MAGKSATMSDTVKMEDGTEKPYSATLSLERKGIMTASLELPDGKKLSLA